MNSAKAMTMMGAAGKGKGSGGIRNYVRGNMRERRMRKFILTYGLVDNEFSAISVGVMGRSSFEAGFNALQDKLIPPGYVAKELVDPLSKGA